MSINPNFKHSELTDQIIGVFYEVYNELGFGFLESVYRNALLKISVYQRKSAVKIFEHQW